MAKSFPSYDDDLAALLQRRREKKLRAGRQRTALVLGGLGLGCLICIACVVGTHHRNTDATVDERIPSGSNRKEKAAEFLELKKTSLFTDYNQNQISADKRYLGKRIRIQTDGVFGVEQIGRDADSGKPFFVSSNYLAGNAVNGRYPYVRVIWAFQSADEPGVLSAKPWGLYMIDGECMGRIETPPAAVPSAEFYILFRNCTISSDKR